MNSIRITSAAAEAASDELSHAQEMISEYNEGAPPRIDGGDVSDAIMSALGEIAVDISILDAGMSGFIERLRSTVEDFSSADQQVSDSTHTLLWKGIR